MKNVTTNIPNDDHTIPQEHENESKDRLIANPICGLSRTVVFGNGTCPYSGECKCSDCVTNDQDLIFIQILRDSYIEKFGIA